MAQSIEQAYNLPQEMWEKIFSFIEPSAQFLLAPVCHQWYEVLKGMRNRRGETNWKTWIGSVYCRPELVLWAKAFDPLMKQWFDDRIPIIIGGNIEMCREIISKCTYDNIRLKFHSFIQICIKYNYIDIARMLIDRHEQECEREWGDSLIKEWKHSPSERLNIDSIILVKDIKISNDMFELIFCDYCVMLREDRCINFVKNGLPLEMIQKYILSVTSKFDFPNKEKETWHNVLKGICHREKTTLDDFVKCIEMGHIETIDTKCIYRIIVNNHHHLLEWIFSNGFHVDVFVSTAFQWETRTCMNVCAEYGRIKMAQIFRNNGFAYPHDIVTRALENNNFDFVRFVLSDGGLFEPNDILNGLLWRINEDSLNIFKYLDEITTARGLSLGLSSEMMIEIIENARTDGLYLVEFFRWFVGKGVSVPPNLAIEIINHNREPELVLFCLEHGAQPSKTMAYHAAYRGSIELMKKVISVLDEKDPVYLAISRRVCRHNMTEWLLCQNEWIEPNEQAMRKADDILDEQYGYFSKVDY